MPYNIDNEHPECSGFAVVKTENNEVVGCHRTRPQAVAQLTALNIAGGYDNDEPMPHDDDENLANEVGMRETPNADIVHKMLAQINTPRLN